LMSVEKQVFWLRDHPICFALPSLLETVALPLKAVKAFVTRYSGATARDFNPFTYSTLDYAKGTFSS